VCGEDLIQFGDFKTVGEITDVSDGGPRDGGGELEDRL
jgi:hypothetical protein